MRKERAPIALFAFNRPDHLNAVLEALLANDLSRESRLMVFIDGPREASYDTDLAAIDKVFQIVNRATGFLSVDIFRAQKNQGLANSIINGIGKVFENDDRVIVLEDDIITGKYFLQFMNRGLELYKDDPEVFGLSGFTFRDNLFKTDAVFLPLGSSWGWATWKRAWQRINFDGSFLAQEIEAANKIKSFNFGGYRYFDMLQDFVRGRNNSWAIRFYASMFLQGGLFLYANKSLVRNIGFDSSGTHNNAVFAQSASLPQEPVHLEYQKPELKSAVERSYRQAFEDIFNTRRFTFRKVLRKLGLKR